MLTSCRSAVAVLTGLILLFGGCTGGAPDSSNAEGKEGEWPAHDRADSEERRGGFAGRDLDRSASKTHSADEIGRSTHFACLDLPYPGSDVASWKLTSCWEVVRSAHRDAASVYGGTSPHDESRGLVVFDLSGPDSFFATYELPVGTEYALVYDLNLERACFTTANGGMWEFSILDRRVVAPPDSTGCRPPPRYEVGRGFPVDCRENPEVPDDFSPDLEKYDGFRPHDCWAVPVAPHMLIWYIGGWLGPGGGIAQTPGAGRAPPEWVPFGDWQYEFPEWGDLTITYADLRWVCFVVEGTGPMAIDRTTEEEGRPGWSNLVEDISGTPCPR